MTKYEYKVLKTKLNLKGKINIPETESIMCELGSGGWRVQSMDLVQFIFSKEIQANKEKAKALYEYKIVAIESESKVVMKFSENKNENILTGFGLEGWRLAHAFNLYYILERPLSEY